MAMKALPSQTIRLLGSSQVITSVVSVVKELLENAFDAGATSIDIRLEDYGFAKVEVRDNGNGIPVEDTEVMAQPHYTSKIRDHADLDTLDSYGFRGEALGSLCAVADVSITTKTHADEISKIYKLDMNGRVMDTKPSHLGQGTTVTALNLFKKLPVRKQYYSSAKRKKEELKKVEDLVMCFGVVWPSKRLSLRHNKDLIWQKSMVETPKNVLMSIFGASVMSNMDCFEGDLSNCQVEVIFPSVGADAQLVTRSTADRTFMAINRRPVIMKELDKMLRLVYAACTGGDNSRYPVGYINISMHPSSLDVNVDPNKTKVLLHDKDAILEEIRTWLEDHYKLQKETKSSSTIISQEQAEATPAANHVEFDLQFELSPAAVSEKSDYSLGKSVKSIKSEFPPVKTNGETAIDQLSCAEQPQSKQRPIEKGANIPCDINKNVMVSCSTTELGQTSNVILVNTNKSRSCTNNGYGDRDFDFPSIKTSFDKAVKDVVTAIEEKHEEVSLSKNGTSPLRRVEEAKTDPNLEGNLENGKTVSSSPKQRHGLTSLSENSSNISTVPNEFFVDADISGRKDDSEKKASVVNKSFEMENLPNIVTNAVLSSGTDKQDNENWSKGTAVTDTSGNIVQPVRLLPPTSADTPGNKRKLPQDFHVKDSTPKRLEVCQPTLLDVISSPQCQIKKPVTSFIHYSKEIRPSVVEEHPNATFEDISRIIGEKWKNLSPDGRKKYEDMAKQSIKSYREMTSPLSQKASDCALQKPLSHKKRKLEKVQTKSSVAVSSQPCNSRPKTNTAAKVVELQLNMQHLRTKYRNGFLDSQQQNCQDLKVVGLLMSDNVWICHQESKLLFLVASRAKECLVYKRLMQDFVCPLTTLNKAISLTEQDLGGRQNMDALLQLTTEQLCDDCILFSDPCLLHNGFRIIHTIDPSNTSTRKLQLVALSQCMPSYGLPDLKEALDMMARTPVSSPEECRPVKIIHYLQGEAVRISRQTPAMQRDEVQDICKELLAELPHKQRTCFHDKPFLINFFDLENIPLTQDSQS